MKRRRLMGAGVGLLLFGGSARARSGKLPKANVLFQFTPKRDARCSGCRLFEPGPTERGPGHCRVVEGAIIRDAWCVLYEPRL